MQIFKQFVDFHTLCFPTRQLIYDDTFSHVPPYSLRLQSIIRNKTPGALCYAIFCSLFTGLRPPTQSSDASHSQFNQGKCSRFLI